jgi:hypothetical protein
MSGSEHSSFGAFLCSRTTLRFATLGVLSLGVTGDALF